MRSKHGFTLIELLVVIGIVAVLAVTVALTLNPAELFRQTRDSQRAGDLTTLTKAVSLFQTASPSASLGTSTLIYIALPDSSATCANLGLPAAPGGYTYACATTSTYQNANGTGWIPLNFGNAEGGSPLSVLPVDPLSEVASNRYYAYTASNGNFAFSAPVESTKYQTLATSDGGYSAERMERGSNLSLTSVHVGVATDSDAQAFFTATGITDGTQQAAVNQLVIDLKAAGIWTKMHAIYPFVGGTATTHRYNLKDPQNTDGAFRIVFSGTWTHDANGILGGGYPAYADTRLAASSILTMNNLHLSIYSRTVGTNTGMQEMGAHAGGTNQSVIMFGIRNSNNFTADWHRSDTMVANLSVANTDARGFYIASRRSSTDFEGYKNGTSVVTNTNATGGSLPAQTVYIGDVNYNGAPLGSASTRNIAFSSIGTSLSDAEAAAFNTAVDAFQTTLGRDV